MIIRAWLLAIGFGAIGCVFLVRLAWLQLVLGDEFEEDIQAARMTETLIPARRGRILDRSGLVLVDNRICHHAAVVLKRLEHDASRRRRIPFHELDERALDLLTVDICARLDRQVPEVRETLIRELRLFPGVAVRRGDERPGVALGLLAFPGDLLVRAEQSEVHNDPVWSALAQSGLLMRDIREAALEEYRLRRSRRAWLLNPAEYTGLTVALAEEFQAPADHLRNLMRPLTPRLEVNLPGVDGTAIAWSLVEEDVLPRIATTIARYLGSAERTVKAVQERLGHLLDAVRTPSEDTGWFYVPAARAKSMARRLPDSVTPREVLIRGMPPGYQRVFVVQGRDPARGADVADMFDLFADRLANGLAVGADTAWLQALIELHGDTRYSYQLERDYRVHHIAFDAGLLTTCARRLSARLRGTELERSALEIERAVTMARRIADREWRGSTRHDPLPIVEDLPNAVAIELSGLAAEPPSELARRYQDTTATIPGLAIVQDLSRSYRFPRSAGHIIGFLGKLSLRYDQETALAMGLDPSGWMGRTGLEGAYDEMLQGVVGRRLRRRTPTGYALVDESPPIAGLDLELVLDSDLQRVAERSLKNWFGLAQRIGAAYSRMERAARKINHGRAGMAVMDVETGGLLVLASSPQFDLRTVRERYIQLNDPELHPGRPLHDHASEAAHPCGSCIKPLTAMLALKEGVVGVHEWIHSPGYMHIVAGRRILREHSPFTPRDFDVVTALQKSSNVFFATMGHRLGKDRLTHYQQLFGLGQRNALDVAWQRPGILPTPDNIARIAPHEPIWTNYRTWSQAIGQGMSNSPLQMVAVAGAVANGGTVLRPHLARRARKDHPYEPYMFDIAPHKLRAVREGMEKVTEPGGTARYLELEDIGMQVEVAAKTGSAEWGTRASREADLTPEHAWLIGYAPADRPRIAFAIFVYAGCSGGRACSGIAKAVLEAYFRKYPNGHRHVRVRSQTGALPY